MQPPQGALTSAAGYHNIFAKEKMRLAKKGDWVRSHSIVLKADERTAKLPEDTQKCDLQQWTKGYLQEKSAEIGDEVSVETAVGRIVKGTLLEVGPYYTHSYGKFVPEIIEIDKQLRETMSGTMDGGDR